MTCILFAAFIYVQIWIDILCFATTFLFLLVMPIVGM